ncbi:MarR family transcriptional regulator [Streptomyces sp. MST-110588]|uniref:MarR family winged helix-turn-helix transcriptional regulator n=1 Tax=Streptomyces sp. MST-110588 TaxID=2833628 RepID=UPI001F5D03C3|nr:MarR family transcriptional regulator [Streptomyces sp. MST-110588]UNO38668.1 MarR family transcriptional regulator [Streptomyces sp. MST-110588]
MKESDSGLVSEELADRLTEVFDLVGPLYRRTQRKVEHDMSADGLSVGVRAVLSLLRQHGPMTAPQMARAQALSRQFVQRMVNDAAARGLVEFAPNPAHKRSSLIRLTEQGQAAITAAVNRERVVLRQAGEGLTGTEIDACLRVLTCLLEAMGDVDLD